MKLRDYIIFIAGSLIIIFSKLDIIADQDLAGFVRGLGFGLFIFFLLKIIYFKFFKKEEDKVKIGLSSRDYVTLILGSLIIIVGYMFSFKDMDISNFLRGMGNTLVIVFIVKSIYKLITRNKHETTRG